MIKIFLVAIFGAHWIYLSFSPSNIIVESKTKNANPYLLATEAEKLLRQGDIVVRLNIEPSSDNIRNFNRNDKKYSHAGIVIFENGRPFIYHILNNEGKGIQKELLPSFCSPATNKSFGIFRYALSNRESQRLAALVREWNETVVSFDEKFDLETNNKMYCSEFVSKVITKATKGRIKFSATPLTLFEAKALSVYLGITYNRLKDRSIIAIDNLYGSALCEKIKEYQY